MNTFPPIASSFVYYFSDVLDASGNTLGEAHALNDGQIVLEIAAIPLDGFMSLPLRNIAEATSYTVVFCPHLSHPKNIYPIGTAVAFDSAIDIQLSSTPFIPGQISLRVK